MRKLATSGCAKQLSDKTANSDSIEIRVLIVLSLSDIREIVGSSDGL